MPRGLYPGIVTRQPSAIGTQIVMVAGGGGGYRPTKPSANICWALLSCLCFPPFACVALICACLANGSNNRDDFESARHQSSCACGWAIASCVFGCLGEIAVFFVFVLPVLVVGGGAAAAVASLSS